jgi:hypothetical protein
MRLAAMLFVLACTFSASAFSQCVICTMKQTCTGITTGFTSCGFDYETRACVNQWPKCGAWADTSFWYWDTDIEDETFWDPDTGLDGDNFMAPAKAVSATTTLPNRGFSIAAISGDMAPMIATAPRLAGTLWNAIVLSRRGQLRSFEYVLSGSSFDSNAMRSLIQRGASISSGDADDPTNQRFTIHVWKRGTMAIAITVYETPGESTALDSDSGRILTAFFYPISTALKRSQSMMLRKRTRRLVSSRLSRTDGIPWVNHLALAPPAGRRHRIR